MTPTIDTVLKAIDEYVRKNKDIMRFLKENRCHRSFFRNLLHTPSNTTEKYELVDFGSEEVIKSIFSYAFVWSETDEGFQFWSDMENKWEKNKHVNLTKEIKIFENILSKHENISH